MLHLQSNPPKAGGLTHQAQTEEGVEAANNRHSDATKSLASRPTREATFLTFIEYSLY